MSEASADSSYIALVGYPNSGKSSLFNALTGSHQKVGNYPGVTVERKEGSWYSPSAKKLRMLDLPGTYSLRPTTPDEQVTCDVLNGLCHFERLPPSLLVIVADASNLERNLSLVLEILPLKIPTILALNMMDIAAKRGLHIDLESLSQNLGIPVFPVIATQKNSTIDLQMGIEQALQNKPTSSVAALLEISDLNPKEKLKNRYQQIDRILTSSVLQNQTGLYWTERLDRVLLHPFWGSFLLLILLLLIFQGIFNFAEYPMNLIETGIGKLSELVRFIIPAGVFQSLIVDGIIAGVGAVVVFIPQILLLFLMILLLEDSGYMARAAFLMDKHMSRVGLHGRAFIPLLSSFACAIPGIMATRTIENKRDRLITILIAPLMACSARIPVYTLLIGSFIANTKIFGPIHLQGLVMLGLYFLGIFSALIVAFFLKKGFFKKHEPLFILELPSYKWPNFRNVLIGMWQRALLFLKKAGTTILVVSVIIWFLSSYPKAPANIAPDENPVLYSYAGKMGKTIEPLIKPLGFDWSIGIGLITGFAAREVIVGSLATIYSVESQGDEGQIQELGKIIKSRWSTATGLSLLIFFVFAMQCFSTLAVVRRETNSFYWPLFLLIYLNALAYLASWATYNIALKLS